jgi:hypothetical protein
MIVHLVVVEADRADLDATIRDVYPTDNFKVAPAQWLIAGDLTSQSLIASLGAAEGRFGKIMTVPVTSYWGWHSKEIWDWLSMKMSK